jgi:HK97 family phage major capsid protein
LLLANIADAVARKLEATILGVAAGSTTQPQGMGYKITTGADTKANAAAPTYASMVALETAVDTSNALVGNLAYITNAGGRGIMKTTLITGTYGERMLLEGSQMNGYPVLVTNSASAVAGDDDIGDLVVFGNWRDLVICQWAGYDITVDPYTLASNNQVKITINAHFDGKGLRGSLATDVHGVTQADQYAYSFASAAIK